MAPRKNQLHSLSIFVAALAVVFVGVLTAMAPQTPVKTPLPADLEGQALSLTSPCDPRTPISSLPFTIDADGSYYLTKNLTGSSGQDGILVNADDVTIDLNGFALIGVPGSRYGINMETAGPRRNISVFNGSIRNWDEDGIGASTFVVEYSHFADLRLFDNGSDGLFVGDGCIVSNCISQGNARHGILTSGEGVIVNCVAIENTWGIGTNDSSVVQGCTAVGNTDWGISLSSGIQGVQRSVITECVATGNMGDGIAVEDGSVLVNSVAYGNTLDGIRTRQSAVIGSASSANGDNCDDDGASSLMVDTLNCR